MEITSENLVLAVQKVILDFESNSTEKLSTQKVADKANSAYTTIRQIKNGSLKSLTAKKAIEISSRLEGPNKVSDLLKSIDANNLSNLAQEFSHLFDYNMFPSDIEELLSNKEFTPIIWAAFGNSHITRDEIRFRWGQDGTDKTDLLIKAGLLLDDNGLIKGISDKAGGTIATAYKQAQIGMSAYNIERSKTQENWMSFQTNSVSDAYIKEFREELRKLFIKFSEGTEKTENIGDKRVFFNIIFDRYMEDLTNSGDKLQ